MLTKEELISTLPPAVQGGISDDLVNDLNKVITDPEFRDAFRDNMLTFNKVLSEGKFKISSYVNAVMYVSYKLMGYNNYDSYMKTFPDKFQAWMQAGVTAQTISAHVAMFNKSKLVTLVYGQALVPVHILNADKLQEAINHQFHLMKHAASEKVQSDAANSLMIHLKPPEDKNIKVNVGIQETDSIKQLKDVIYDLANAQNQAILEKRATAQQIAEARIIDAEVVE